MSKIGDLVAKLKLDGAHYEKGLKTARKSTRSFADSFKSIKTAGLAVWGAVGVAAVKFGKEVINASQRLGDAWARTTAAMKGGWQEFVRAVGDFDLSNITTRMREAAKAAKEMAAAKDALFEAENASSLFGALNAEKMADLERIFRDTSKSDQERIRAGKELLRLKTEAYNITKKDNEAIAAAARNKFLTGTIAASNKSGSKMLEALILNNTSNNPKFVQALSWLTTNVDGWNGNNVRVSNGATSYATGPKAWKQMYAAQMGEIFKVMQGAGIAGTMENAIAFADLGRTYNARRNDADVKEMLEPWIKVLNFGSQLYTETKRIQTTLDGIEGKANERAAQARAQEEAKKQRAALAAGYVSDFLGEQVKIDVEIGELEGLDEMAIKLEEEVQKVIDDAFNPAIEGAQHFLDKIREINDALNDGLKDAIVASLSDGIQAVTDSLMGLEGADATNILAAIARPFGDFAKTMGGLLIAYGISMEAFKDAFANPAVAIGAGVGLIAAGSLITSAISSFNKTQSAGAGASASAASSAPSMDMGAAKSEITIYVKGRLNGSDILLAGQNTQYNWSR